MSDYQPHFGYTPNPAATRRYVSGLAYPSLEKDCPWLMGDYAERDVFLWLPLMQCHPSWKRGSQAIGDCTSWGNELACTMLLAMQAVAGESEWISEAATEPIYGGARVENNGGKINNGGDGWYGSGCAEWLNKWGVVLRIDYSPETGNPDHDLRRYSGEKAKEFGRYGCGGKNDDGKLDAVAKKYPVKEVSQVNTPEAAAAAIAHGCPIAICSDIGYGSMKRDSDGVVRRSGSWAHCMCLGGIRYRNGKPEFRCFQSWGKSCSGPDPGIDHQSVSDCSWWIVESDCAYILRQGDSYAFSRVAGFALPPWNFGEDLLV